MSLDLLATTSRGGPRNSGQLKLYGDSKRKGASKMNLATNIEWGSLVNRIRKLQKQWNYWYPLRQPAYNMASENAQEAIAEKECARIAPFLYAAKERKAEIERSAL